MSAVLFERLGYRGAALAEPLLERVGELCAAAAEAAEAADAEDEEEGEEGAGRARIVRVRMGSS